MRQRHPTEKLERIGDDLGVLASLLGEPAACALADEAVPIMQRHRTADELALLSALFGLWASCVGNEEAQAARWASLRSEPHSPHKRQPGRERGE